MPRPSAFFVGATGLIGALALPELLARAQAEDFIVYAPSRRALTLQHPNLQNLVVDVGQAAGLAEVETSLRQAGAQIGCFLCALGTTLKVAGSQSAFKAVDHDLVLDLARLARNFGAAQAIVVSSVGASAASSNFYLRTKGAMEAGIQSLGFARVDFLHPGLLLGQRKQARSSERIAQLFAPLYNPLLCGPLRRYRAVEAKQVARTMVAQVGAQPSGAFWLGNADIVSAGG